MENNVIPLKASSAKFERFKIFSGDVDDKFHLSNERCVGLAFLRGGSKTFSLRLWMFPLQRYFLAPVDLAQEKYDILSLEEYESRSGVGRSEWHNIGNGEYVGNYLKLKFHLLEKDLYLSLFPNSLSKEGVA